MSYKNILQKMWSFFKYTDKKILQKKTKDRLPGGIFRWYQIVLIFKKIWYKNFVCLGLASTLVYNRVWFRNIKMEKMYWLYLRV